MEFEQEPRARFGNIPKRKNLNMEVSLTNANFGSVLVRFLWTRNAKSAQKPRKSVRLTTWKTKPAIIMLTPRSLVFWSSAIDAMAPPAAWRISEIISQVTKMNVYVLGLKNEMFSPNNITTRERQMYIDAERKAGAIVSVQRDLKIG